MTWSRAQRTAGSLAALVLGGVGIAGTGGQVPADRFRIQGCSLACASGPTMATCGIVNVHVNEELAIHFTQAVDLSSVLSFPSAFRIFETGTGQAAPGTFRLDPGDRRTLIFEPQLTFNQLGVPSFGFGPNASYQVLAPGVLAGDPPPYVLSQFGLPLENRLLCTITADQGVMDYVPGPPSYTASVQVVETCEPGGPIRNAPAPGARCVWAGSNLTFAFDDIMYLAALVTPLTGTAPYIVVRFADTGDNVPGTWSFSIDMQKKTTTAVFDPTDALPPQTKIEVLVPNQVSDMILNPHTGPHYFAFVTE